MSEANMNGHVSEAPLVLFTVCVPSAVGAAGCALVLGGGVPCAALALLLASVGMAGSIFHLARPLRAPGSLRGLKRSALSQEIGAVIAFWALLALWLAALVVEPAAAEAAAAASSAGAAGGEQTAVPLWAAVPWGTVAVAACALATLWGVVLLWVINRAYRVETRPAWNGPEGLMELAGIACGCGGALYALLRCALAVAGGAWGSGGTGAVAPLGLAVPAAAALLAVAAAAFHTAAHARRAARVGALAAANEHDERARLTLERMAELEPKALYALSLGAAAAALELAAVLLAFAPTFPWPLLLTWTLLAGLQLAVAILQRARFYQLAVEVKSVPPLRK